MSSIALLIVSGFVSAAPGLGGQIAAVALPAILLMEVLGALIASFALRRSGESARPDWSPTTAGEPGLGEKHV
jgi:hypothetical protein